MSRRRVVVIKLGSRSLVDDDGRLDARFLNHIADQVAAAATAGWWPVLVSSGAVAAGMGILDQVGRPPSALAERQALAAIGQADLIHRWQRSLGRHDVAAAQVLLTAGDFDDRVRYLNLTATLRALREHGVVPIINENDVISVEELALGDNDRLSAMVSGLVHAERLLLLTDIDGLYDRDPRKHDDAVLIDQVAKVDDALLASAGGASLIGTGGMRSKLVAAKLAGHAGVVTTIAKGRVRNIISRLLGGERIGTAVAAEDGQAPSRWRRWLGLARTCRGSVHLDQGAVKALRERGRSLLAVGITAVDGTFDRGDTVALLGPDGTELAKGLANLSAAEIEVVRGHRWDDGSERLGYAIPKTAIHRDNILLID